MSLKFQKKKEDFLCEHCGHEVKGTGFTNHCPQCLWSKHVDVYPGDRREVCGGMMEPVDVIHETREYKIVHRCHKCHGERKNKLFPEDNFDVAVAVAKKKADRVAGKR